MICLEYWILVRRRNKLDPNVTSYTIINESVKHTLKIISKSEKNRKTHLSNDMEKCFKKKAMKFQTDNIINKI